MTKPENPYAQIYKGFREQTGDHELRVLFEDGLHRHLRVQAPGTRMWSWDVTTWPGHLAVSGDVGAGYMFTREPDMLEFFSYAGKSDGHYSDGSPSIDFRYWAEKIVGPARDTVKVYDSDAFLTRLREHLEEHEEMGTEAQAEHEKAVDVARAVCDRHGVDYQAYLEDLRANPGRCYALTTIDAFDAVDEDDPDEVEYFGRPIPESSPAERRQEVLDEARWHSEAEHEARAWLSENEDRLDASDTWEWDLSEYDSQFLFACYCIDLATRLHREHRTALAAGTQKEH